MRCSNRQMPHSATSEVAVCAGEMDTTINFVTTYDRTAMQQDPNSWTPVSTERLVLRRPSLEDRDTAIRIHMDPNTNRFHPNPESITAKSSADRFDAFCAHWTRHGFGVWAVARRHEPNTVVGFTGLTHRTVHGRSALNLYYRYTPAVWGNGYATEGALQAVSLGQSLLPSLPIVAFTTQDNAGSQRTAQAAGLTRHHNLDIDYGSYVDVYLATNW